VGQMVTLGLVLPAEVLPPAYQVVSGSTPLGWLGDALLAAVSTGDPTRVTTAWVGLNLASIVALVIGLVGLGRRRRLAVLTGLGISA